MADFRILDPDLYNNSTGSASLTETKMKSTAEEAYQAQLVKVKYTRSSDTEQTSKQTAAEVIRHRGKLINRQLQRSSDTGQTYKQTAAEVIRHRSNL